MRKRARARLRISRQSIVIMRAICDVVNAEKCTRRRPPANRRVFVTKSRISDRNTNSIPALHSRARHYHPFFHLFVVDFTSHRTMYIRSKLVPAKMSL